MITTPEGLETNGMLKPPTGHEQTDLKVEGLAVASQEAQPEATQEQVQMEIKRLTLTESDLLRAERAFKVLHPPLPSDFIEALNDHAFAFSQFIILSCPEGKERAQALGQVHAAALWAKESYEISH